MNEAIALVDNDFVQRIAEIKLPFDTVQKALNEIFHNMNIRPFMHELVYSNEFVNLNNAQLYFDNGLINVLLLQSIFQNDPEKIQYYCFLIPELYKKFTGLELEFQGSQVLTCWKKRASLGEVHSLTACFIGGYGIFLSDDLGSKQVCAIINRDYSGTITVYNRREFMQQLPSGVVDKGMKRAITHK